MRTMPCCDPTACPQLSPQWPPQLWGLPVPCTAGDSAGDRVTDTTSASPSRGEPQQSVSIPRRDLGVLEGQILVCKVFLAPSHAAQTERGLSGGKVSQHSPAVCALEPEQGWGTESVPGSEVPVPARSMWSYLGIMFHWA